MAGLAEFRDVTEPVAVVLRDNGSVDVYGYVAVVDQRSGFREEVPSGRYADGQVIEYTSFELSGYSVGQVVRYADESEQDNVADLLVYIRARSGARPFPVRESQIRPHQAATARPISCGPCGAEIEKRDNGLWETGGDTAGQRRHCTESRDHLHHPDAAGLAGDDASARDADADYGDECVIELVSGWTIRTDSSADSPEGSTYVRVCDPDDSEADRYWTSDEWREAPEGVMGAILGAAKGGTRA
jgi:hypothetical protein